MSLPWSFRSPLIEPEFETFLDEDFHQSTKLDYYIGTGENPIFSTRDLYLMSRGFRQFKSGETVSLEGSQESNAAFFEVVRRRRSTRSLAGTITISELSHLLNTSLGATAIASDAEISMSQVLRAYPSAGGLSSIETYVIASKVDALRSGTYHFNAITSELQSLCPIEESTISECFFGQKWATEAAAWIVLVAVLDRLSPKYGNNRAYRLALLDAGHAAQNVLLCSAALDLNACPLQGYSDDALARAIEVDSLREIVVHTIAIGRGSDDVHTSG